MAEACLWLPADSDTGYVSINFTSLALLNHSVCIIREYRVCCSPKSAYYLFLVTDPPADRR